MLKDKVEKLAEQVFEENKNLFLISLEMNSANHIKIVIDGDEGVSVNDCITVHSYVYGIDAYTRTIRVFTQRSRSPSGA